MTRIPTARLNEEMLPLIEAYPPPATKGKYIKIKLVNAEPKMIGKSTNGAKRLRIASSKVFITFTVLSCTKLEYYSVIRSIRSIENADVCILMLDATRGVESQDYLPDRNQIQTYYNGYR